MKHKGILSYLIMAISFGAILTAPTRTMAQSTLSINPALTSSPEELQNLWTRGYQDATCGIEPKRFSKFATRSIRTDKFAPAQVADDTTVTLLLPKYLAYFGGVDSYKTHVSEDQKQINLEKITSDAFTNPQEISFAIVLRAAPRAQGMHLKGDITDETLRNTQTTLRVNGKEYQPKKQSVINARLYRDSYTRLVDEPMMMSGFSDWDFCPVSWIGNIYPWTTLSIPSEYEYYVAPFYVSFPLYDKDGNPIITPATPSVQLDIQFAGSTYHADFDLNSWLRSSFR